MKLQKSVHFRIFTSRIKDFYQKDLNNKTCIDLLDDTASDNNALTQYITCNMILFPFFPRKERLEASASVYLFLQ